MKSLVVKLFVVLMISVVAKAYAVPAINKPAPEFKAVDSYGKEVSLKDFAGKKVILEWTNNECPFVVKHYNSGNMQSLQKKIR